MIVGAGTFGASLAWWLAGRGDEVVLVDQFEPGDARATSGGETRLIRCSHGADADYTAMARRARTLWRELEQRVGRDLMTQSGVSWFAHARGRLGGRVRAHARARSSIPTERWSVEEAAERFPSFNGDDLAWVLHEPEAGRPARPEGGPDARRAGAGTGRDARPAAARSPTAATRVVETARVLEGDRVVWSCGGWLARSSPSSELRVTQQELFFFDGGPAWRTRPAGSTTTARSTAPATSTQLGVKVAWDQEGPPLEPDADLPPATPETERLTRGYAADRFPALAEAPLVGCKRLPLRALGRLALHRRAAPRAPVGLDRRRRLRPRLQARPGDGRAARRPPGTAASRCRAHFALGERAKGESFRSAGSNF